MCSVQCRAVAAAALGDPDKAEPVVVALSERFRELQAREVDILMRTTHTMERDVFEVKFLCIGY